MAATTTSEITHAVNNYYNPQLLRAAQPTLVHTKWAQVRNIPRNNTDVIKFRRYTLLSAATTPLTEGTTPSETSLAITDVSATVLQYGAFVILTDKLQFSTLDPILMETARILGQQSGNTLDQLARDVMVAGTTVQYASSATSRGTVSSAMKITRDEIRESVRTLQDANAMKVTSMVTATTGFNTTPIRPCYVGIISPKTHYDLKDISGFVPVSEYASQGGVMEGEVGFVDEVRFVMTTNGKVFSAGGLGGIDVHGTMILGADYYGTTAISGEAMRNIVKPLGSAGTTDPLDQRSTSGWKAAFIAMRLNETFAVRIEHAVSS